MLTASELRDMTDVELVERIKTQRREMFGLRFKHSTGELENTAILGASRRGLARALTHARGRGIDLAREGVE